MKKIFSLVVVCTMVAMLMAPAMAATGFKVLVGKTGSGSITGAGTYMAGDKVSIIATANNGYKFSGWTATGIKIKNLESSKINFEMPNNKVTLKAKFVKIPTYAVTLSKLGAGTVVGKGKFVEGDLVTIKATPKEGNIFIGWTDVKGITLLDLKQDSITFSMPSNTVSLKANFIKLILGDVNADGKVTEEDATLLLRYTTSPNTYSILEANADVNKDGEITSEDAIIVSAYAKKQIGKLPHEHAFVNAICACGIKKAPTLLGDVNNDGFVNSEDSILLLRYTMNPNRFKLEAPENADMNMDGVINSNDAILLENQVKILLGDADGDGNITKEDAVLLLRHTTNPSRYSIIEKNCDVNEDGELTSKDATIIEAFVNKKIDKLPHVNHTFVKGVCACGEISSLGDVNGDKKIDSADATLLLRYTMNPNRFSIILENADINGDGIIDSNDATALSDMLK